MEEIKLGDKVMSDPFRIKSGTVIAINRRDDNSVAYYAVAHCEHSVAISVKSFNKDALDAWNNNKLEVLEIPRIYGFYGYHITWVLHTNLNLKIIGSQDTLRAPSPRICAKCGQFDEYAAPSSKHNGEMRCYLHC